MQFATKEKHNTSTGPGQEGSWCPGGRGGAGDTAALARARPRPLFTHVRAQMKGFDTDLSTPLSCGAGAGGQPWTPRSPSPRLVVKSLAVFSSRPAPHQATAAHAHSTGKTDEPKRGPMWPTPPPAPAHGLGPCFGISLDTLPLSGSISRFTEKCKERLEVASPGGRLTTTPSERLPSAAPVTETSARLVPLRPEGGDAVEHRPPSVSLASHFCTPIVLISQATLPATHPRGWRPVSPPPTRDAHRRRPSGGTAETRPTLTARGRLGDSFPGGGGRGGGSRSGAGGERRRRPSSLASPSAARVLGCPAC